MTGSPAQGLAIVQRPPEVEASLWRRLRFENEGQCRELLFNRHLGLAKALAWREFRRRPPQGLERGDFEQLAMSGLLEAIDRFDPLLGAPFAAFAKHRIRGAIADGAARSSENAAQYDYRRRVEKERLGSLARDPAPDQSNPISDLADLAVGLAIGLIAEHAGQTSAPGPYESGSWQVLEQRIMAEIEQLPATQRSIMVQHYRSGMAFNDIAALLQLSKGRVSQLHRAAIMRLRNRLNGSE
jgi:RNA polymerase sigma factor for flagellar operon FliA